MRKPKLISAWMATCSKCGHTDYFVVFLRDKGKDFSKICSICNGRLVNFKRIMKKE